MLNRSPELVLFLSELREYMLNNQNILPIVFGEEDSRKIDTAVPQDWANKLYDAGLSTERYFWSYISNRIFGEPVHIFEELMSKFRNLLRTDYDRLVDEVTNSYRSKE